MLKKILFLIAVNISTLVYADLHSEYSKVYSKAQLTSGEIIHYSKAPKNLQEGVNERTNADDLNFNIEIIDDGRSYKIVSFGDLANEYTQETYVLSVYDKQEFLIGSCIAKYNEKCELLKH